MTSNKTLRMENISKTFAGEKALDGVDFEAAPGEITALLGINGAGKSTLMNILGGIHRPDAGAKIYIDGKIVDIKTPNESEHAGVAFIKQEPVFFYEMTVAENVFIGNLFKEKKFPLFTNMKKTREETQKVLDRMGVPLDPKKRVKDISIGERQIIEIVRALAKGSEIVIFDEPTSSLSVKEKSRLFEIIGALKAEGKTVIYITHFLEEVMEICDRFTVLRDGKLIGSGVVADVTQQKLAEMIVGREFINAETVHEKKIYKETLLKVEGFYRGNVIKNANFELKRGEILGIWGLMRSGRTELLRAILGLDPIDSGVIYINRNGEMKKIKGKRLLKECGYVTESRHTDGLVLEFPLWKNNSLPTLKRYSNNLLGVLNNKKEKEDMDRLIKELSIRTPSGDKLAEQLSGGNQQKVVLSKWINKNPEIIIMDEPTRGVDVGAKYDIYNIIREMVANGTSVLLVSSEVEEITDLCDRVLIMRHGELVAEIMPDEINEKRLMEVSVLGGEAI